MTEPFKSRLRRRRWLVLLLVLLTVAATAWLYPFSADRRLRRALAETDRLDPRWRLADIEADRAAVPDGDNGALTVIAVATKLLGRRLDVPSAQAVWKATRAPNVAVSAQEAAAVRADLAQTPAAVQEARKLADQPRGRWPHGTKM